MEPLERLLNLVGLLLETPHTAHVRSDPETLDAYRADNVDSAKRMFERDKDHTARVRHPAAARRYRRLGHRAGLHHPEGPVLPAGDRLHPGGARAPCSWPRRAVVRTPPRSRPSRKLLYGAGAACWRASRADRSRRAPTPERPRDRCADAAQRRRRVRFGYRTSHGRTLATAPSTSSPCVYRGRALVPGRPRRRARRCPRLPAVPVHQRSRRRRGRAPSRPTGSARPTTCEPGRGPRRRKTTRDGRASLPTSRGGPRQLRRAPTDRSRRRRVGRGRRCRWPTPRSLASLVLQFGPDARRALTRRAPRRGRRAAGGARVPERRARQPRQRQPTGSGACS